MKIHILLFALIIITLTFLTNSAYSQSRFKNAISPDSLVGNVYGTVEDSLTGKPVSGAEVFLFTEPLQNSSGGNTILTDHGNFIIPDLNSAAKHSFTDDSGGFLINYVRTPAPYKFYTIVIEAEGYNQLIIDKAPILPGATMAFQINAKLLSNSHPSFYYKGTSQNGPFMYRFQAIKKNPLEKTSGLSGIQKTNDLNYSVFATREGLIGGTCANGHVIVSHDHFVALPSFRVLNKNDKTYEFEVKLTYGNKTVIAPVWDVGPWNINDDYWNPDSLRAIYATLNHGGKPGLGEGVPESQAAYLYNYNQDWSGDFNGDGSDHYQVKNPAGIDLADGTFWDDLGLSDNSWVQVNFLWRPGVSLGDSVAAADTIPVLSTPGGNSVGQVPSGKKGIIVAGPGSGNYSGTYYIWWKINWGDSLVGWSFEKYLSRVTGGSINVTIQTDPSGLQVTVDGFGYTSPSNFTWVADNPHTISTSSQSSGTNTKYVWSYWNDRRLNPHTIYPYTNTTYTAYFETQYKLNTNVNPSNGGTISPANGTWLKKGTVVSITATPSTGYEFMNWSGDGSGTSNPLILYISKPLSITANFSSTSAINNDQSTLPSKYEILQNYPNPFNPTTTIKYALPYASKVKLEIYNLLGKKVRELVNQNVSAGYHEVKFDGSDLSSGIYLYRMLATSVSGNKTFNEVRKLVLLK